MQRAKDEAWTPEAGLAGLLRGRETWEIE
jgi:hypothetical protein